MKIAGVICFVAAGVAMIIGCCVSIHDGTYNMFDNPWMFVEFCLLIIGRILVVSPKGRH